MAGIDKTYTDSYEEYKEFKDWADSQILEFFDGHKVCIGNWVWHYEKEDFDNGEIPIMNTPPWLDIYLMQYCRSKFVLDRMKYVYGEEFYNESRKVNLRSKPPEGFEQNRRIIIKRNSRTKFPLHNKPYRYKRKSKWMLQSKSRFNYNDETKRWVGDDMYYPYTTNTATISSIKSLVRHLRKQYLPSGAEFRISGRYMGEDYTVHVY